jgi:hypothetical protein
VTQITVEANVVPTPESNHDADDQSTTESHSETVKVEQRKIRVFRTEHGQIGSTLIDSPDAGPSAIQNKPDQTSHRWLDTMDNFADRIKTVWARIEQSRANTSLAAPVIVALIDDGVDMCHESLRGKIFDGKSFDFGNPLQRRMKPFWVSEKGHGTVMANMITRVCPMARVYAIKLETRYSADGMKSQIGIRSAAAVS